MQNTKRKDYIYSDATTSFDGGGFAAASFSNISDGGAIS